MISLLFAAALYNLGPGTKELHDADLKLMQACFKNGMARGKLLELMKFEDQKGLSIDPRITVLLGMPIPRGCDGVSP